MSEATEPVEAKLPGSKSNRGLWIALLVIAGFIGAVWWAVNAEYSARIARAQNMEAVSLLTVARTGLTLDFQDQGKWPGSLDKVVSATSGSHTESVRITKGAGGTGEVELTATMRTTGVDQRIAGKTIRFISSDGGKTWTCRPGTMPKEHLPPNCREN